MDSRIKTNTFKEHLANLLHEKNISKAQFCRDIGVSKPTLDKWLNIENDILPTLANTLLIAEKYNISIDWLTGNEVKKDNLEENTDIVRKIFEAIIYLDEHLKIKLEESFQLGDSGLYSLSIQDNLETIGKIETKIKIDNLCVTYFVQEYLKIQKILYDPAYADYKKGMLDKLFEKLNNFYYDHELQSIYLNDENLAFDIDYNTDELIIHKKADKTPIINTGEFEESP